MMRGVRTEAKISYSLRLSPTDIKEIQSIARERGLKPKPMLREVVLQWLDQQQQENQESAA